LPIATPYPVQVLHLKVESAQSAVAQAKQEFEQACHMMGKGIECFTVCTLKAVLGANPDEVDFNAEKYAILKALEDFAKHSANKWAKRLVPVVGEIDTAVTVYGTAVCTTTCYKK
jgi:hypothetical protein